MGFAFETIGVHRGEAWAAVESGPETGAAALIGARREVTLRRNVLRHGNHIDRALRSILREHTVQAKAVWGCRVQ